MFINVSCKHNVTPDLTYAFISREDLKLMDDFITWRKSNQPHKQTIISLRPQYDQPSSLETGIEAKGILNEYFNFLETCQPNHSNSWYEPIAVNYGDIYIDSRHYVWRTMNSLGETETKSTYLFPLHYEVIRSLNISFYGTDEERKQNLIDFNERWNHVMEVLIYSWETHKG